jgi:Uncharacterized alpha/beta hydrolase domain (DUF2235)
VTAFLAPTFSFQGEKWYLRDKFFDANELRTLRAHERRELPPSKYPKGACDTRLFFGFFLDGTKNNYVKAEKTLNHSNVARLYDCFPGLSVPGVLPGNTEWDYNPSDYTNFFKTYIPGVSSPFSQIGDDGEGTAGGAFASKGEPRIAWALIQAINNVHRFFLGAPIIDVDEAQVLANEIGLLSSQRASMAAHSRFSFLGFRDAEDPVSAKSRKQFVDLLKRLHKAVSQHWPVRNGRPFKIGTGTVKKINISIFGFSRGATQARAFTNWLFALTELDGELCGRAGDKTLGGFPVKFDFLGLFDTVASVGLGNTLGNSVLARALDGHAAWADTEKNLCVPDAIPCLHLIAAHEIRRSFPVDSISRGGVLPKGGREVVFPGVHSDVGCGYSPLEQGRGKDPFGKDMISRFPLLYMYRHARLAGVPLKLEFARPVVRERFAVANDAVTAFNGYIEACSVREGTLTAIMREQAQYHILWRRERRVSAALPLHETASFARASTFDKNNLHSANLEFEEEIKLFNAWHARKGKDFVPRMQPAGFDDDYENEWEEISRWWYSELSPVERVLNFFDTYVHDSRAWFKISSVYPDNEPDLRRNLERWELKRKRVIEYNAKQREYADRNRVIIPGVYGDRATRTQYVYQPKPDGLTQQQRDVAVEYAKTGQLPRMITSGREPHFLAPGLHPRAGYLRYRKVYAGGDSILLSSLEDAVDRDTAAA